LVAIIVVGGIYLNSLSKPSSTPARLDPLVSTSPAAVATRVTAPAASLVLELMDVSEILPGGGWTEPSGGALVDLSALSTSTSTFAYGQGGPVQLQNQVMVFDSDALAATAYTAAVSAYPYPSTNAVAISEGEETSVVRSQDPVWRDPGPNGNFTGAYTRYDRYQFVLVWREHNVVALISFAIDDFDVRLLQSLADREETRIQGVLRP
jgi:hypothetical protein